MVMPLPATLPNSLHVVVPHGAHGFGGLEGIDCIGRLNTEFVEKGTVKGLDTSCVKSIRRKDSASRSSRTDGRRQEQEAGASTWVNTRPS